MTSKIMGQKSVPIYDTDRAALEASEARYRRLFEAAQDGILILDAETGMIDDVNPFLMKMLGYSKKEIIGKKLWEIGAFKDIKASKKAFLKLQTKEYVRYEDLPLETKGGSILNVEFVSNVYSVDHQRVIQCNIRDLTGRKKDEEIIQRSLKEKDILLKELHHRVKNNLQIITSLLQLKISSSKYTEVINVFKQMQERIRVMALVHAKLCETKDFVSIDISTYIHGLVEGLFSAYGVNRQKISVKIDVANVFLTIDTAVPCGLIINELVTNAIKYAFPRDSKGKISIMICAISKGRVEIIVGDNGIGLRKGFNIHRVKTIGLALVISTIESQLGGKVKVSRAKGTQFKVTFKNQILAAENL